MVFRLFMCVALISFAGCWPFGRGPEEDLAAIDGGAQGGMGVGVPILYRTSSGFSYPSTPAGSPPVTAELTIRNDGEGPLELDDFEFEFESPSAYTLTYQREGSEDRELGFYTALGSPRSSLEMGISVPAGRSVVFYLKYAPDEEGASDPSGSISFSSNDRNHPQVTLPVLTVKLSVEPGELSFGSVSLEESAERELTVTNNGEAVATVERVELSAGGSNFSVTLNGADLSEATGALQDPDGDGVRGLGAGQSFTLLVSYTPSEGGVSEGELVVTEGGGAQVVIPLSANRSAPCLNLVFPDEGALEGGLDFGFVAPEGEGSLELIIESCGAASLELLALTVEGEGFSLGAGEPARYPARLAPATDEGPSARAVQLLFTPPDLSIYTGTLVLETNDPNQPRLEVPLRGSGLEGLECPVAEVVTSEFTVMPYELITLDGSSSVDADSPNGRPIRYEWTVVQRPANSSAQVVERLMDPVRPEDGGLEDDPLTPQAFFYVDRVGEYVIELTVQDDQGLRAPSDACPQSAASVHINALGDETGFYLELTWHTPSDPDETDSNGTDVDLHLLHPEAPGWANGTASSSEGHSYDCYYANAAPDWGPMGLEGDPRLLMDDANGAGPETIQLEWPEVTGERGYRIGAHYYSSGDSFFGEDYGPSDATLRVYVRGELAGELTQTLNRTGAFWDIAELQWGEESAELILVNQMYEMIP